MSNATEVKRVLAEYITAAGVPITEFDPDFVVKMMSCMMVSFHKYGRVAVAYPDKYDASADLRARMAKYRATGDKQYLVDAANFAMIEAMCPSREDAHWGVNDAVSSPGRTNKATRQLILEDNGGNRIAGDTILHHPDEAA